MFHVGANVAKYAGQHLSKRLVNDEHYKKGEYAAALKSSFLGCDAEMKSRAYFDIVYAPTHNFSSNFRLDPEFVRETSGCTAVTTLITRDNRIFCVSHPLLP